MSSRSYLSIGDVLTLLREEFPDVTISKIRFLESQGLVNPERSPSGYRKFFEHDVERLRWVLRQQREHFLPLKVIRDRLAAGDLSDVGDDEVGAAETAGAGAASEATHRNGAVSQPAHAAAGAGIGTGAARTASGSSSLAPARPAAREAAGSGGNGNGGSDRTEEQLAKADNEAMARILADASRRAAMIPEGGGERAALHVVTDPSKPGAGEVGAGAVASGRERERSTRDASSGATASPAAAGPGARGVASAGATAPPIPVAQAAAASGNPTSAPHVPAHAAASGPTVSAESAEGTGAGVASPKGAASTSREVPGRGSATAAGTGAKGAGSGDAAGASAGAAKTSGTTGMVTGASLTAEELSAASGLSTEEIAGLQGFGLIEPVLLAGILTYDEDALTVARLAADFRKYGIEPRHLRQFRNATDREVGLIEQVIIPLLRQRNPESRQRAIDAAEELGALGQTMRATLLRAALRRHVGG